MSQQFTHEQAERRVNNSKQLSKYRDFIMADWPNAQEHYEWVCTASVREILEWVAANK